MLKGKLVVCLLITVATPELLNAEIKEAIYSNGTDSIKVSVDRTDVLIKSKTETLSFPGLIEFEEKLILPSHRSGSQEEKEKSYRAVSAVSTDLGKTWKDLPSTSPFADFENSGLYGYLKDGSFLYMDTFPLEAKQNPAEWGAAGYHVTQRVKNPSFRVRSFSKSGEFIGTFDAKLVGLPWQEASYELYGSILQLANGDLLAPFQCHIQPPKEENGKYTYAFSVFIARSTDEGKTFKYEWTFDPIVHGKRIGDEGLVEPDIAVLPNGEILCIMRTGSYSPMYQAWSRDNGKTWSQPVSTGWPGVKPRLRVLKNGVLACSSGRGLYGRPQVTYAMFSIDGTGKVWEPPFEFYTGLSDNYTFNMERDGKLYVVYSVLSATNPPYEFEYKLPFESISWTVLNVTRTKSKSQ
jgi:hypothetical protein